MLLKDTAAVITGGASGLGEATARHFAAHGAQVTILDRDADRGRAIAADIGGHFAATNALRISVHVFKLVTFGHKNATFRGKLQTLLRLLIMSYETLALLMPC